MSEKGLGDWDNWDEGMMLKATLVDLILIR